MDIEESALISVHALSNKMGHQALRIIDASWHMPNSSRNARDEYTTAHIDGALFFDLDATSNIASPFLHMLPSPAMFTQAMSNLGISNDSYIVVYDSIGLFSAARLWWMLRVFGHRNIFVLDGGLPAWKKAGFSVTSDTSVRQKSSAFLLDYHPHLVASKLDIQEWSESGAAQICDARSPERFWGKEPEPRAGVRSGHIPQSINVHYKTLLNADGALKSHADLKTIFADQSVDIDKPIVATCGSGVTACIIALALYELGYADIPVYDGSWAEWGASSLPIAI